MKGYYRIVRYNLGGLVCVVRHETDGYVSSDSGGVDALAEALGGLAIGEGEKTSSGLTVVRLEGRADVGGVVGSRATSGDNITVRDCESNCGC